MNNLEILTRAVRELDEVKVLGLLNDIVAANPSEAEAQAMVSACQKGMSLVGELYEKGEYFVADLIFAGELLTEALDILKPVIGGGAKADRKVSIVLATVQGDLHDIGKNIFKSMAEATGFEVFDLGIDQSAEAVVENVKEVQPQIVGLSGLLTLAVDSMKNTVDALEAAGVRAKIKILIGGNCVTEAVCRQVGADAFTTNAAEGVKICQGWVV